MEIGEEEEQEERENVNVDGEWASVADGGGETRAVAEVALADVAVVENAVAEVALALTPISDGRENC